MYLKIKRICMITCATAAFTATAAQPADLLGTIQRLDLPVEKERMADFSVNPAQMFFRDSTSVSTLGVSADVLRMQKPVMEQLGDGHTLFNVFAGSYTRLSPVSVVWGTASFTTGRYNNIRWSDCIDYLRIAPYVLGDEAGGNLSTRRYTFSGGYSRKYGSWTVGADAAYRAEIAYRNHDPRIKTIVSDLDFRIGGTRILNNHSLGLDVSLNVYNQSCDLDFYSPVNEINTYTLTGLGTSYNRFMGNTNKNSGYTSLGYTVSAQWLPVGGQGLAAEVAYNGYRMNQQLRSFNNITLGYTDNRNVSAHVAWQFDFGRTVVFRPSVHGSMSDRKGTENLFGTSSGGSYDKIGSRSPYSHSLMGVGIDLPVQIAFGGSVLTVAPSVGYDRSLEKYTEPQRRLEASHIVPEMMVDFSAQPSGSWQWAAQCNAFYSKADSGQPLLTGLDIDSKLGQCVVNNFDMMRADSYGAGISVRVSRLFRGFAMTLSASFKYIDYKKQGDSRATCVSLSASF